MQEKLARLLIETAADRWITGLQKDTRRSARKLAEFGDLMSKTGRQHWFFEKVQQILKNESSGYYAFARRLAVSVDRGALKTFGLNFGYNSLVKGARMIAAYEEESGNYLPWTITMECPSGAQGLSMQRRLIEEGRSLGVYTYILDAARFGGELSGLRALFSDFQDCAFLLLCRAPLLLGAESLQDSRNVLYLICPDDPEACRVAASLRGARCLWGLWSAYNEQTADEIIGGRYASFAAQSECDALFLCAKPGVGAPTVEKMRAYAQSLRANDSCGYFVCELRSDIEFVDGAISPRPHALFVHADGSACCTPAAGEQGPLHFNGSLRELVACVGL